MGLRDWFKGKSTVDPYALPGYQRLSLRDALIVAAHQVVHRGPMSGCAHLYECAHCVHERGRQSEAWRWLADALEAFASGGAYQDALSRWTSTPEFRQRFGDLRPTRDDDGRPTCRSCGGVAIQMDDMATDDVIGSMDIPGAGGDSSDTEWVYCRLCRYRQVIPKVAAHA